MKIFCCCYRQLASTTMLTKRARTDPPTVQHVMHYARLIMERDPFKDKAPREEDRNFRALFGCPPSVVLDLWNRLSNNDLLPADGTMTHLLWTFMYTKTYVKWKNMKTLAGGHDPKTIRKWMKVFLDAVEQLEGEVIVWENRKRADRMNDCLVSVDTVDFRIPFHGRNFHSHKWKYGSGLRYEVALCILTGDMVWISGPYEAGLWNDVSIFRSGLLSMLEDGERVEADDGYIGVAPRYAKCPRSMGHHPTTDAMQSVVRRRQETINKRCNQFNILKAVFRGDIGNHGKIFRFVAIATQLAINNGEPLFQVDYEDPDYDNMYIEASDDEDDDDGDDI